MVRNKWLSPFQAESLTQMGREEEGCLPGTFALPLSLQGVCSLENVSLTGKLQKNSVYKKARHPVDNCRAWQNGICSS